MQLQTENSLSVQFLTFTFSSSSVNSLMSVVSELHKSITLVEIIALSYRVFRTFRMVNHMLFLVRSLELGRCNLVERRKCAISLNPLSRQQCESFLFLPFLCQ